MLQACAVNFTRFLYDHCNLPDNHRHIYIYGSKLFFSTSLGIISILLISYLIGSIASGILFVLIFVSIRLFVGGFHAKTYGRCFWLSNSVFLITLGGATLLENCHSLTIALILICSVGVIWTLAPIRNSHHPLSEKTYQKNKKIGRFLTILECTMSIFVYLIWANLSVLSISITSIAAVAVMMIIGRLKERRTYHG